MKNLFYILSVVAIGVAAFFGWQVKDSNAEKIERRDVLFAKNKKLTDNIEEQTENKKVATKTMNVARDDKNEAIAKLDKAKADAGALKRTLAEVEARQEEAAARINKVDKLVAEIKEQVPGDIRIEDVPGIVSDLREEEKSKNKALEELDLIRTKLKGEVTKLKDEIVRTSGKIADSKERVGNNDFEASVSAVNNEWGFLIIGAGEKSGLTGDSKLLVKRGGRFVGKVAISSLEANQAIAEVVPGSLGKGVVVQAGDRVILEDVRSN